MSTVVFDSPTHANGGCIFDTQLLDSTVTLGGGGYMRTGWYERVQAEDEILLKVIKKFLQVIQ